MQANGHAETSFFRFTVFLILFFYFFSKRNLPRGVAGALALFDMSVSGGHVRWRTCTSGPAKSALASLARIQASALVHRFLLPGIQGACYARDV